VEFSQIQRAGLETQSDKKPGAPTIRPSVLIRRRWAFFEQMSGDHRTSALGQARFFEIHPIL
jgi:hypothetical protein